MEHLKKKGRKGVAAKEGEGTGAGAVAGEEVVLRAAGKAIQKCLELGLWFQQREEYAVRLVTGSVGAIDDIAIEEEPDGAMERAGESEAQVSSVVDAGEDAVAGADVDADVQMDDNLGQASDDLSKDKARGMEGKESSSTKDAEGGRIDVPETRIRYTSSLEVYVSLR